MVSLLSVLLTWPVIVFLLCLVFRRPLTAFLDGLRSPRNKRYAPCLLFVVLGAILSSLAVSAWGMPVLTSLLAVLLTWPVAAVFMIIVLRRELRELLARLVKARIDRDGVSLDFERAREDAESLAIVGKLYLDVNRPQVQVDQNERFTDDDLVTEFNKIPGIEGNAGTEKYKVELATMLRRRGILTKQELTVFTSRTDIQDAIRKLYQEELRRRPEEALDPVGLAAWGGSLFVRGMQREEIEHIRSQIRRSPEYVAKHPA